MSDQGFMPFEKEDGTPYRPSNGTEGEIFRRRFCNRCTHQEWNDEDLWECTAGKIFTRAFWFNLDHEKYPEEWQWQDGDPVCTAFEPNPNESAQTDD